MKRIFSILLPWMLALGALNAQGLQLKESKEFSNLGEYVRQAQFSPYRNYFAFTIGNNTLRVYNRDWELVLDHQGNPKAVGGVFAFSPDERFLAYGRYKGFNDIAIIRLSDMKVLQVLSRHSDYVSHLEFSNAGDYLVSCSSDESAVIWKLKGEEFTELMELSGFESRLSESSFSHDDRFLATGDSRGHVLIMEKTKEGFREYQRFQNRRHGIESICFHPEYHELLTGSTYGLLWYRLQKEAFVLEDSITERMSIGNPVHYSYGGDYLAAGVYQTVKIFSMYTDRREEADAIYRHMDHVFGANFSEDGDFLVSYGSDQRIIIWEIPGGVGASWKAGFVHWLGHPPTKAQRCTLAPISASGRVILPDIGLTLPKDEFETTAAYRDRQQKLSDIVLGALQEEMHNYYGIREGKGEISIPLQNLLGYNADLEIYKIRFMDTEAGVRIPIPRAKELKGKWEKAQVLAKRVRSPRGESWRYSDFRLKVPGQSETWEVLPVENPFHAVDEKKGEARAVRTTSPPRARDSIRPGGTTYALMFASNVYDYYDDLVNPVLDARTIAMELEESYGVKSEVVVNATLAETASAIREFASREYGPEDNLMVFFAGHGVYDEVFREGYVISRDSRSDDEGKTSYLSHSNLRTMVNNIDCPHIFLVMDVCFGGTFDPHLQSLHRGGASVYADISTEEFVERKLKYKTRLYLTSGGKEYVPDGRPGFHSPFARRFIESLRHYGGEDGVLTTAEILQFVEKVNPQPRFGEFGDNEPGSDFIFVLK